LKRLQPQSRYVTVFIMNNHKATQLSIAGMRSRVRAVFLVVSTGCCRRQTL